MNYRELLLTELKKKHPELQKAISKNNNNYLSSIAGAILNEVKKTFRNDKTYYASTMDISQNKLDKVSFSYQGLKGLFNQEVKPKNKTLNFCAIYLGYKDYANFVDKQKALTRNKEKTPKKEKQNTDYSSLIKMGVISIVGLCLFIFFWFKFTPENKMMPVKNTNQKDRNIPNAIYGKVESIEGKTIENALLSFNTFNYKIRTNKKGFFTIKDSLLIYSIVSNEGIDVWLSHKQFKTKKYSVNEDIYLFNDTLSLFTIVPAQQQNEGSQINIDEIINENGTIHIGPNTTINN